MSKNDNDVRWCDGCQKEQAAVRRALVKFADGSTARKDWCNACRALADAGHFGEILHIVQLPEVR